MTTLLIPHPNGNVWSSPLLGTMNFHEHESILMVASNIKGEIQTSNIVPGVKQKALEARLAELVNWVEQGHVLVVLGLSPTRYYWQPDPGSVAANASLNSLPPFNSIKLTAKSGSSIRVAPLYAGLLARPIIDILDYEYVMQGPKIIPLMFVKTTGKTTGPPDVVCAAVQFGAGFVIFAPANSHLDYYNALLQVPSLLRTPTLEMPPWVDSFLTRTERSAFSDRADRTKQIEQLRSELATVDRDIDVARQLKQLFVASGSQFEAAVEAALAELGFQITKGPHPRADLLATNGQRLAAIEAKGIEGTAKEEYVRQVMMWMPEVDAAIADDIDQTSYDPLINTYRKQLKGLNLDSLNKEYDCKGILVLGTFRLTPLDQRTALDFPENVIRVMSRQDICALTGLQLFNLVVLARADQALKESFREAILSTRGVLSLGGDWKGVFDRA